jgi:hypothetical protein
VTIIDEKSLFFPDEYFEEMGMKPKLSSDYELLMSEYVNFRNNDMALNARLILVSSR